MADSKRWWIAGATAGCVALLVTLVLATGTIESGRPAHRTWTNDRSRLSGERLAHFVPFAFEIPPGWQVLEDGTGQSPNFVKIETATADQITIENFAVGWYADVKADRALDVVDAQFAQSFPSYRRLFDRVRNVDGIHSPGFAFEVNVDTPAGTRTFWGRAVAVPVDSARGLVIVMFAGEDAPEVGDAADVGEAGDLERILDSFDIDR